MKFFENLTIQLDKYNTRRIQPDTCLLNPITLKEEFIYQAGFPTQSKYILNLGWDSCAWIDNIEVTCKIQHVKKSTINLLKNTIYGELYNDLHTLRHMIDYGSNEESKKVLDLIIEKVGL